jgi:hypothetical protein
MLGRGVRGGDEESVSRRKSFGGQDAQNIMTTAINETTMYPKRICRNFPNLMRLLDKRHRNHAIPSLINHYRQYLFLDWVIRLRIYKLLK